MRIREVRSGDPLVRVVYRELLEPAFPACELDGEDELVAHMASGLQWMSAVVDGHRPLAVAVAEWFPSSRVLLLAYLAVREERRSTGIGSLLLSQSCTRWRARARPALMLTELEHPALHQPGTHRGDPADRLRFYARHGARGLDLPYFQPGTVRVPGMVLTVLRGVPGAARSVPSAPVRGFLSDYFTREEGAVPADPAAAALFAAARRPEIPVLALGDPCRLPWGRPAGAQHRRGQIRRQPDPLVGR
jgi:GNAT superfamily N-acetyltransferase